MPDRNRWTVLAVVLTGFFMILLDGTIMNVAIPAVQRSLHAGYPAAQWMLSGYALAYGLVLIPAGRLGDQIGHRRMFVVGMAGFTVASLLCSTASTADQIIGWRVLQGVTAGMMNPAILAMIQAAFPPEVRGRAFTWYGAVAGIASAAGPVLGGVLIGADVWGLAWRSIFLLNVPIGVVALVAAGRVLPEHRARGGGTDPVGVVLLAVALLLLEFPLIQGYGQGWPWSSSVLLVAAVPVSAGFVRWETRTRRTPLVDVALFRDRVFGAGVAIVVCQFVCFASLQFALSAYLQLGLGASPVAGGLALLPFAVGTFVGSSVSDRAVRRFGRHALHAGATLLAVGTAGTIAAVHLLGTRVDGPWLAPGTFVAGAGALLLGAPIIGVILHEVTLDDAGSAGGVVATAQRLGQALGVAIVGTALFATLPAGAATRAPGSLPAAYTAAIQVAALFCLAAAVATGLLVFLLPTPNSRRTSPGSRSARPSATP
ncbi:MAG TPA: MFS transporter [Pseudonocardiaceae bacterium]|jgi:EmrB/QacA subfamily drug resistance transporter